MARILLSAILALLALTVVPSLPSQDAATRWYPLHEGGKWHYRVLSTAPAAAKDPSKKVVMRVDKQEPIEFMRDGKTEKIFAYRVAGRSEDRELVQHYAVAADGIYALMGDKVKLPPLRILKLPAKAGDAWDCDIPLGGGKSLKGSFTVKEEEYKFQGKPIKTLHVTSQDFVVDAHKMTAEYWFAADVGIVKYRIEWGTFSQTLELEKYEPAK